MEERIVPLTGQLDLSYGYARKTFSYSIDGELKKETWFDAAGNEVPRVS